MRYRRAVILTRLGIIAAVLLFLEVAPRLGWVDSLTLVPLSTMFEQLFVDFGGDIWKHIATTGLTILISFALAILTGIPLGYLTWKFTLLRSAVEPYLTSYYALPVFAFYPVLIAIFGLNMIPVVILAWGYSTVAVIANTLVGLDSVSLVYLKTARVYRMSRVRALFTIQIPAAAGAVFTGIRLAATYAVIGVVASEFILATQGLGWLVAFNYNSFRLAEMYSSILLVMAFSGLIIGCVFLLEKLVLPSKEKIR